MADGNITVSSVTPEMFARERGEVTETSGSVALIRASGKEVQAVKGSKIYLNDTLISRDDSAVIVSVGDTGVLVLGQNQQIPLSYDFFNNITSLEQVAQTDKLAPADPADVVDFQALEQAIAEGQSIEDILEPTAAGNTAGNEGDADSSFVIFYQRTGDSLLPVSGFDTTTFGRTIINPENEVGDLDDNNLLNSADDIPIAAAPPSIEIPNDNSLGLNSDDVLVSEAGTVSSSFTLNAPSGLASLSIAGVTITAGELAAITSTTPFVVSGANGELEITDYNEALGAVNYTFTPFLGGRDHSGASNDSITNSYALIITDASGVSVTASLDIGYGANGGCGHQQRDRRRDAKHGDGQCDHGCECECGHLGCGCPDDGDGDCGWYRGCGLSG